ncbi:hypothetical protein K0M31_007500 [Melipona bicolor]|uniref:Uncharacterized protein n=1 Tax=Melipona bicolor TaxID=60889 RepID=A0AA40GCD9_9HYME|nr:hypothetical protein K0M31_007500 [Melipona bicolor]
MDRHWSLYLDETTDEMKRHRFEESRRRTIDIYRRSIVLSPVFPSPKLLARLENNLSEDRATFSHKRPPKTLEDNFTSLLKSANINPLIQKQKNKENNKISNKHHIKEEKNTQIILLGAIDEEIVTSGAKFRRERCLIRGKRPRRSPEGGAAALLFTVAQKAVSDTSNLLVIVTNYSRSYGPRLYHASQCGTKRQVGRAHPMLRTQQLYNTMEHTTGLPGSLHDDRHKSPP